MQRFFIQNFKKDGNVSNDPQLLHQMLSVLRFQQGDECVIFDGNENEFLCTITQLNKKIVRFAVKEIRKNKAELPFRLSIYQAMPTSQDRFEWLIEKATELGVTDLIPIITERTERRSFSKRERLERIIKESTEQTGRGKLLQLHAIISYEKSIASKHDIKILAHSQGNDLNKLNTPYDSLPSFLSHIHFSPSSFHGSSAIWIGPEGGFTHNEILDAISYKIYIVTLGPRILRTETAPLVIVSALLLSSQLQ